MKLLLITRHQDNTAFINRLHQTIQKYVTSCLTIMLSTNSIRFPKVRTTIENHSRENKVREITFIITARSILLSMPQPAKAYLHNPKERHFVFP